MDPVGSLLALPDAERVIAACIAPFADDGTMVRRSSLDALAQAGFLGDAMNAATQREVAELIARADASTWFCWAQHFTPMRVIADGAPSTVSERWHAGLSSGALLAGVAFAHVRRAGEPNPIATRVPGGWRIDGSLDWVTSWDIADVVVVQVRIAEAGPGRYVHLALPAGRSGGPVPGMVVGEPLALLAMGSTHTRPARFDACVVDDDVVAGFSSAKAWHETDDDRTVDANPATFGVCRGALTELATLAHSRGDARMAELVDAFAAQCRELRGRAYALAGHGPREERVAIRAQALDLVQRAASAVVIARAGSAMLDGSSAGRRAREALFLQVQAQTPVTRAAQVRVLLDSLHSGPSGEQARG